MIATAPYNEAEARLQTILRLMNDQTFGLRRSEKIVGGRAMLPTCYATQKYKIMKKVIINIVLIIVFAFPCLWLTADSYFLQFLGVCYAYSYVRVFLVPVYKRVHEFIISSNIFC